MKHFSCGKGTLFLFFSLLSSTTNAFTEAISLRHAVELALGHNVTLDASSADQQHAFAAYIEARDAFRPQLVAGSGLGATWGFPLSLEGSAPSIANINAQSALINLPLHELVSAAKEELKAAGQQTKDQRDQVMQDTILTYTELTKWAARLTNLRQDHAEALSMEEVVKQRIQEGVDNPSMRNQARLTTARAHLRLTQALGAIQILRSRLAQLTGVAASSIEVVPESIPALPAPNPDEDAAAQAVSFSPLVQAAEDRATAQGLRARGEHLGTWPTVDFAAQYAVLSTFNNYQSYFRAGSFQRNNATIGVAIRFPFFSPSQHARVREADADALHARKQVQIAKNQVSEETLKLQRAVDQLAAAREVAELSYQIAASNLDAARIRTDAGTATLHDSEEARTQASERYQALQDADFELERSQIGLLRATGALENWLLGK